MYQEPSVISCIDAVRSSVIKNGDLILLRDFSRLAPPETASFSDISGKWRLLPYRLKNSERGNLLAINKRINENPSKKVQFHAGLRMNLFWSDSPWKELFNGRWCAEHPSSRKPGEAQLNYADPQARRFILDLMLELAHNYDIDGICMDFTRWPPVADPIRHDDNVLTSFIITAKEDLKKIELEAWLKSGVLDFICVQAWDIKPYIDLAKKYNTPCYAIQDNDSIHTPHGSRDDPDWGNWNDPQPGEEHQEKPRSFPCLDPTEWELAARKYYRAGTDGVALVNAFMNANFARRLGHIKEIEERCDKGEPWGLEIGRKITLLPSQP